MEPITAGFPLISATLQQVEEAARSDAKYQGWPLQRPAIIALRQQRGKKGEIEMQKLSFLNSPLLDFSTILDAI